MQWQLRSLVSPPHTTVSSSPRPPSHVSSPCLGLLETVLLTIDTWHFETSLFRDYLFPPQVIFTCWKTEENFYNNKEVERPCSSGGYVSEGARLKLPINILIWIFMGMSSMQETCPWVRDSERRLLNLPEVGLKSDNTDLCLGRGRMGKDGVPWITEIWRAFNIKHLSYTYCSHSPIPKNTDLVFQKLAI